jgi:hypothetical protein
MCLLLPNGTVENNMIRKITITTTATATATDMTAINYCMVKYYYCAMSGSL